MQMHNKMEIEGAASDAARPQAADFPCEAGRMRRFDGQICSLSGKNAAEAAAGDGFVLLQPMIGEIVPLADTVRRYEAWWRGID